MKKSLLFAGVALTAMVLSGFALFADDTSGETTEPTVNETFTAPIAASIPANNATILSTDPVTSISMDFAVKGDNWISVKPTEDRNVVIARDGQTVYTIPTVGNCTGDRSYPGRMNIALPEAISTPGNYTVSIPAGLVLVESTETVEDGVLTAVDRSWNAAGSIKFTIVKALSFQLDPAPGDVMAGQLAQITFTYPEGAEVNLLNAGDKKVVLRDYNANGQIIADEDTEQIYYVDVTEYSLKAEGNKLILTALNPENIKAWSKNANYPDLRYDFLQIPANMWSVTYQGETENNVKLDKYKYWVAAFVQSAFDIFPTPGEAAPADDFANIIIRTPSAVSWKKAYVPGDDAANQKVTVAYLKNPAVGTVANLYPKNISANGKVLTLGVQPVSPTDTQGLNHLDYMLTGGGYYIELVKDAIQDANGTGNAQMTWGNLIVNGTDKVNFIASSPKNNAITDQYGQSQLSVTPYVKVTVNNPDAIITLKKDGQDFMTWKVSEVASSSAAVNTAAGIASAIKYSISPSIKRTDLGVYTISIPEGAYRSVENPAFVSAAYEYRFFSPSEVASTVSPEGITTDPAAECAQIDHFTLSYPEGAVLTPITNNTNSIGSAKIVAKNLATQSMFNTALRNPKIEYNGNKLEVSFTPITEAVAPTYIWGIQVPAGMFMINYNGIEQPNTEVRIGYNLHEITPGYFLSLPEEIESLAELQSLTYYQASQSIFVVDNNKKATLYDPKGNVVTTYTANPTIENQREFKFTADITLADYTGPAESAAAVAYRHAAPLQGTYKFEIAPGLITFGSSFAGASQFTNAQAIVVPIKVGDDVTGIEAIDADAAFDIYAIDGRLILRAAHRDAIPTLAPGLYIINGQKLLVK